MSDQSFVEQLVANPGVAGTSFGTFTTAKTVIPPTSLITLRENYFKIGKALEIDVWGGVGTLVTTPGTITFQVKIGSAIAWTSGAIQLNATAHTDLPFHLKVLMICRTIGSGTSATCMGMGELNGVMFTRTAGQVDGVNSETTISAPITTPTVGAGFDSTIANILDFFAGFSISSASNTVTVDMYTVTSLN